LVWRALIKNKITVKMIFSINNGGGIFFFQRRNTDSLKINE
jgi:hypothetical protein